MNKLLLSLLLFTLSSVHAQQTRILFLGNSYTYSNDLPGMFYNLALSGGDSVIYDSYAPGGYTFQQHSNDANSIAKIYSQKWDYVVIQGQSQEPSFPPNQVASQTYPYARLLDSLVRDNDSCTETVFYMTWGKKYGDQMNCAGYPILCTFDGVTSRLRESYLQMAEDNNALVAPAGVAWHQSWHGDTLIDLWVADASHPSVAGTYLTACVFYGTIFRKTPTGLPYSPISASSTNTYLQGTAHRTVFDSLDNWNIGAFDPVADFDFLGIEATRVFTFNCLSPNIASLIWDFGDGATSSSSGQHTYADTGTYTVTLTVFDACGRSGQSSQTFHIGIPAGIEDVTGSRFQLFPNPVKDELIVECSELNDEGVAFQLQNSVGETILESLLKTKRSQIDVSKFPSGVYIFKTTGYTGKILKQ